MFQVAFKAAFLPFDPCSLHVCILDTIVICLGKTSKDLSSMILVDLKVDEVNISAHIKDK